MNSAKEQVLRHRQQLSKKVCFSDSDFQKAQPPTPKSDKPSGNWGGSIICVEVARKDDQVAVRDSKNPRRKPLVFSNEEWKAFLIGAKDGQFDVD